MTPSAVAKLVEKWNEQADAYGPYVYKEALRNCARELNALRATAPPEQAEEYTKEMIEAMEERSKQPQDSLARKGPSPELGNADAPGHPSPTHPGERSTAKADRSSPESLPQPQAESGGALSAERMVRHATGTLVFTIAAIRRKVTDHRPECLCDICALLFKIRELSSILEAEHKLHLAVIDEHSKCSDKSWKLQMRCDELERHMLEMERDGKNLS